MESIPNGSFTTSCVPVPDDDGDGLELDFESENREHKKAKRAAAKDISYISCYTCYTDSILASSPDRGSCINRAHWCLWGMGALH